MLLRVCALKLGCVLSPLPKFHICSEPSGGSRVIHSTRCGDNELIMKRDQTIRLVTGFENQQRTSQNKNGSSSILRNNVFRGLQNIFNQQMVEQR